MECEHKFRMEDIVAKYQCTECGRYHDVSFKDWEFPPHIYHQEHRKNYTGKMDITPDGAEYPQVIDSK